MYCESNENKLASSACFVFILILVFIFFFCFVTKILLVSAIVSSLSSRFKLCVMYIFKLKWSTLQFQATIILQLCFSDSEQVKKQNDSSGVMILQTDQ